MLVGCYYDMKTKKKKKVAAVVVATIRMRNTILTNMGIMHLPYVLGAIHDYMENDWQMHLHVVRRVWMV